MNVLPNYAFAIPGRCQSVLLIATIAAACQATDTRHEWTTTVNTVASGQSRVSNAPPASGAEPTWHIVEELRIGAVDEAGAASFGQIRGFVPMQDGGVAVLDAQAQEVRIFDADGKHLRTFGGKGGGPGELQGAWGIMQASDGTLWVPDHSLDRMSLYDPASGFKKSYPFNVLRYGFVWDGALTENNTLWEPSITLGAPRRNVIRVYNAEMALLDTLPLPSSAPIDPKNPPGAFYWEAADGKSMGYFGVPFYATSKRVLDPRGAIWSTEPGHAAARIKRWVPNGDTTLIIEISRSPVPVSAAERDSVVDRTMKELKRYGAGSQDWSKIPSTKPAIRSMFLAENGQLWVEASTADSLRIYDVLAQNGRYVGTAATPLKVVTYLNPYVRGDQFWAVVTDDLDVSYVVRGKIVPSVQ